MTSGGVNETQHTPRAALPVSGCYPHKLGLQRAKSQQQSFSFGILDMSLQSAELQSSELQSLERERIFDTFRRWGYLDANLDPFGGPVAGGYPEIRTRGGAAEGAPKSYFGSLRAQFIHPPQPERRQMGPE